MDKRIQAFDSIGVSSRYTTDEGFLVARGVISRTGVQTYLAGEIGVDGDPLRKIVLYRPESEVFNPASIASFDGKPVTIGHPPVLVTADNWKEYAHGDVKNVTNATDGYLGADMIFKTPDVIKALDSGKSEISNGYTFTLDLTAGTTPDGQAFDGIQRNIKGNHVALVEKGRCGSACRVGDENPDSTNEVNTMTDRKVTVDGIPLEVSETAAGVIEKLVADRDAAVQLATDAETAAKAADEAHKAELAKLTADHAAAIDTLQKDVMTPEARDAMLPVWAEMVAAVKKHSAIDTEGKTCATIRREFVTAVAKDELETLVKPVLADKTAADASDEQIKTAFGVLAAALDGKSGGSNLGELIVGGAIVKAGDAALSTTQNPRDTFLSNLN